MTVVDAALIGTVAALAVAMIAMSWRISRAIQKSANETNARIDAANAKGDETARYLGTKIDTGYAQLNAKIDDTARDLGAKIDAVGAKGDATARDLGAKIDATNSVVSDIRERVARLEGPGEAPAA